MKVLRVNQSLTVVLSDGTILEKNPCNDELYQEVENAFLEDNEEKIIELLSPKIKEIKEEIKEAEALIERIKKSSILSLNGDSVYIKSISELSVPPMLIKAILGAEEEENEDLLQSYLNFWTLCSLNPDSRARENLFWFLQKYEFQITRSGLFVSYRNVVPVGTKGVETSVSNEYIKYVTECYLKVKQKLKKNPSNFGIYKDDESNYFMFPIDSKKAEDYYLVGTVKDLYNNLGDTEKVSEPYFTDAHSKTFDIRIGKIVSMPREECDSVQENTCSRGLNHVAYSQRNLCLN